MVFSLYKWREKQQDINGERDRVAMTLNKITKKRLSKIYNQTGMFERKRDFYRHLDWWDKEKGIYRQSPVKTPDIKTSK